MNNSIFPLSSASTLWSIGLPILGGSLGLMGGPLRNVAGSVAKCAIGALSVVWADSVSTMGYTAGNMALGTVLATGLAYTLYKEKQTKVLTAAPSVINRQPEIDNLQRQLQGLRQEHAHCAQTLQDALAAHVPQVAAPLVSIPMNELPEIVRQRSELESLKNEHDEALNEVLGANQALLSEKETIERKLNASIGTMSAMAAEILKLDEACKGATETVKALKAEIENLTNQLAEKNNQIQSLEERNSEITIQPNNDAELQRLKSDNDIKNKLVEGLNQQLRGLIEQLAITTEKNNEFERHLHDTLREKQDLMRLLSESHREVEAVRAALANEMESNDAAVQVLANEVNSLFNELANKSNENRSIQFRAKMANEHMNLVKKTSIGANIPQFEGNIDEAMAAYLPSAQFDLATERGLSRAYGRLIFSLQKVLEKVTSVRPDVWGTGSVYAQDMNSSLILGNQDTKLPFYVEVLQRLNGINEQRRSVPLAPPVPPRAPIALPANPSRNALLEAIRAGNALRKVEEEEKNQSKANVEPMAAVLAQALADRREYLVEGSDSDEEEPDAGWDD